MRCDTCASISASDASTFIVSITLSQRPYDASDRMPYSRPDERPSRALPTVDEVDALNV